MTQARIVKAWSCRNSLYAWIYTEDVVGLSIQASVYPSEVWELQLKCKVESCIFPKTTGMELKRGGLMIDDFQVPHVFSWPYQVFSPISEFSPAHNPHKGLKFWKDLNKWDLEEEFANSTGIKIGVFAIRWWNLVERLNLFFQHRTWVHLAKSSWQFFGSSSLIPKQPLSIWWVFVHVTH